MNANERQLGEADSMLHSNKPMTASFFLSLSGHSRSFAVSFQPEII